MIVDVVVLEFLVQSATVELESPGRLVSVLDLLRRHPVGRVSRTPRMVTYWRDSVDAALSESKPELIVQTLGKPRDHCRRYGFVFPRYP